MIGWSQGLITETSLAITLWNFYLSSMAQPNNEHVGTSGKLNGTGKSTGYRGYLSDI